MRSALPLAAVAARVLAAGGAAADPRVVVFAADRAPLVSGEVYRLGPGRSAVDLSRSPFVDERPVVSRRGGHVAFLSNRSGAFRIDTVGLDGRQLRALPVQLHGEAVSYAWSPDGRELLVVATAGGPLGQGPVDVVRDGRTTYLGRTDGAATQVGWTPDGSAVSWVGGDSLHILDARSGHRVAEVPLRTAATGWTDAGLFAGDDGTGHVVVYDTRGRLVRRFPGTNAAFSFDGAFLASIRGHRIELRRRNGELVRVVTRAQGIEALVWTRPRTLFVATAEGAYDLDVSSGGLRRTSGAYPTVATTGRVVAWTSPAGGRFAVHVLGPDGRTRTLGTVGGCTDDGSFVPAVDPLAPAPDGRSVVYASRCYEPLSNLYAATSGGAVERLTKVRAEQLRPRLSPDGARIAYLQSAATGLSCKGCPSSLWVAEANGAHARQLTDPPDCTFDDSPSWSPDGTRIVFSRSACDSAPDLMTISPDGGPPVDLHVAGADPAWGPSRIAYLDVSTVPTSIWTMLPDGSSRTRIGAAVGGCAPAWSSDGRLAYCNGAAAVEVVTNGLSTRLALPFARVVSLAWSPSGGFVVGAKPRGGATFDIFSVAADGATARRLTTNLDATF